MKKTDKKVNNKGSNWLIVFGCVLITAALVPVILHFIFGQKAVIEPSPRGTVAVDTDGFPEVDWDYWQSINPDVIGWVTVPGTNIDYAIVQAQKDNPQFYLNHDVYGNFNIYGCPYLDYRCAEKGLLSLNSVIYGHNMIDGSMFANFGTFVDQGYAKDRSKVLLQTPDWKKVLNTSSATTLNADYFEMRFNFSKHADLKSWYNQQVLHHDMKLHNNSEAKNMYSFVTCSYTRFSNERTWVCAQDNT